MRWKRVFWGLKKHLELPHCAKGGEGSKFKSGGGVGSLFVKDKRVDQTKSCEIQWIYKKKPRNYIVYVWEI